MGIRALFTLNETGTHYKYPIIGWRGDLHRSHLDKLEQQWRDCEQFEATGQELEYILHNAENLPAISNAAKMVWTGEFALYLARNIHELLPESFQDSYVSIE